MAIDHSNFEFPTTISTASPNHVLFCGKLITRQSQPHKPNSSVSTLRSSSGNKNQYHKIPAVEEDNGGESCWELLRPLKRRGLLVRALVKASLCIPMV
ncbi:hypothetical protein Lal_00040382 [Lupinus albus]|nr:hypothetical protein Lal_00040382 [Lupinus albus]